MEASPWNEHVKSSCSLHCIPGAGRWVIGVEMTQLCPRVHTMAYTEHLECSPTFDRNHMQSSLHCTQTFIGTLQFEHSTAIRSTHDGLSSVELTGVTSCIARTCHCEKRRANLSPASRQRMTFSFTDFNIVTCVCQALPFHHLSNRDAPVTTHVVDRFLRPDIRASRAFNMFISSLVAD